MNQKIMLGTASKSTLLPVFIFYQDFLNGSLETGGILPALFLYQGKKTAETVFYHILRHLIFHAGCRGSASFGINKCEGSIVICLSYNIQCFLEIFFCFSWKSDHDICCQRNIRDRLTDLIYQLQIFLLVVTAVHFL